MKNVYLTDKLEVVMTADQLVIALHEMRDELLKTSQMVKDYSVYMNSVLSGGAIENFNELLDEAATRSRPPPG